MKRSHKREHPCPVCGGHDAMPRGKGVRCSGFTSDDGKYAHCSREERAGELQANGAGLFAHYLAGPCKCGVSHNGAPAVSVLTDAGDRPSRVFHETSWGIKDSTGKLVCEHIRRDRKDGTKGYSWRVPSYTIEGLHGVRKADLPLYGAELLAGPELASPVVVVEGEKAADALRKLGVLALGTVTGAPNPPKSGGPWPTSCHSAEVLKCLSGRAVYLWPDNDPQGHEHMKQHAARLEVKPRIIKWSGARDKGDDAADFVARGGTMEDFKALLEAAKPWTPPAQPGLEAAGTLEADDGEAVPVMLRMSEVVPAPVRWLWPGRVPLGKLTVLDGDPGLGKSLIALDLAARVSTAREMPDGTRGNLEGPAGVVILSAEDDPADTIRPRLDAAGGDPAKVVLLAGLVERREDGTNPDGSPRYLKRERLPTLADIEAIRSAVVEIGARLVVVDPLMAYLAGKDAHVDGDIRSLLAPLARLAAETGAAVLVVRHLNKSGGGNPLYRGGGSIGIVAAARAGLLVATDPDDETGARRVLAVTKHNLSQNAVSLAYRIEPVQDVPRVEWLGPIDHDATALLRPAEEGDERSAVDEAARFLEDALASGPRPVKEVKAEARRAGISERTLERVKGRLRVRSEKLAFTDGWGWRLPEGRPGTSQSPVGGLGALGQNGPQMAEREASTEGRQPGGLAALGKRPPNGGFEPSSAKTAKAAFGGKKGPCGYPSHVRRWRSTYGVVNCGTCHPPADPELVAEWIGGASEGEA